MNCGVAVSGRAAASPTQPLPLSPVANSLRYPAVPVCTTSAIRLIGLASISCRPIAASISRGTA